MSLYKLGSVSHLLGNTSASFQGPQHKKETNSGLLYTHHHGKRKEQETNRKLKKLFYQQPVQTILFVSWALKGVTVISLINLPPIQLSQPESI